MNTRSNRSEVIKRSEQKICESINQRVILQDSSNEAKTFPGLGIDLGEDHARPKSGIKTPCWTQTALEKTLAGPKPSATPWLHHNF